MRKLNSFWKTGCSAGIRKQAGLFQINRLQSNLVVPFINFIQKNGILWYGGVNLKQNNINYSFTPASLTSSLMSTNGILSCEMPLVLLATLSHSSGRVTTNLDFELMSWPLISSRQTALNIHLDENFCFNIT